MLSSITWDGSTARTVRCGCQQPYMQAHFPSFEPTSRMLPSGTMPLSLKSPSTMELNVISTAGFGQARLIESGRMAQDLAARRCRNEHTIGGTAPPIDAPDAAGALARMRKVKSNQMLHLIFDVNSVECPGLR